MRPEASNEAADAAPVWSQRVGGFVEVPALLRGFGVDPAPVLASAGLSIAALADVDARIPFAAADALLGVCVASTGCAHFGLLVGQRWGLAQFGALGELMRHSRTVGEALQNLVEYQHLYSDAGAVFLLEQEAETSMGYALYRRDVRHPDQIYDTALAIGCNLLRELGGERCVASEVVFSRHQPVDPTPYRQHFRAPLRFDHEHSAVRFPAHWQNQLIPGADAERRRALRAALDAMDSDGHPVSELHRLRLLLLAGKSSGDELAQTLSLHRRTLSRRLRSQGTTFQKVLDEVRFEVARELLERTRTPIEAVAAALCYADVSAFVHAFRRWTGTTPSLWRKGGGRQ